jgi:hypothetical protein
VKSALGQIAVVVHSERQVAGAEVVLVCGRAGSRPRRSLGVVAGELLWKERHLASSLLGTRSSLCELGGEDKLQEKLVVSVVVGAWRRWWW